MRQEWLVQLRTEAPELMKIPKPFSPKLVGSVWRGTASQESDVGVTFFMTRKAKWLRTLKQFVPGLPHAKWIEVTERGRGKGSYYIWLELPLNDEVEIILRSPEEKTQKAKSEIYGDEVVGLT